MGEGVSTSRALLLIVHHRERTEGKETQDRQGERCGDGLRYRNYRSEVILQELLAAIGGHFWLDLPLSSRRLAVQKLIAVVLTVLERQYAS